MLDFETPTYVTAKEAQHLQSEVNTAAQAYSIHYRTNGSVHIPQEFFVTQCERLRNAKWNLNTVLLCGYKYYNAGK